jgi:hypothetical protein
MLTAHADRVATALAEIEQQADVHAYRRPTASRTLQCRLALPREAFRGDRRRGGQARGKLKLGSACQVVRPTDQMDVLLGRMFLAAGQRLFVECASVRTSTVRSVRRGT